MNSKWEESIRQKLARHEEPAPQLSWGELDKVATVQARRHIRARRWRAMGAAAVVVVLVMVGAGVAFLCRDVSPTSEPLAPMASTGKACAHAVTAPVTLAEAAVNTPARREGAKADGRGCARATATEPVDELGTMASPRPSVAPDSAGTASQERETTASATTPSQEMAHDPKYHKFQSLFASETESLAHRNRATCLSLVTYFGNGMADYSHSGPQPLLAAAGRPYGESEGNELSNSNGVVMTPTPTEHHRQVSHRQPLRFGLGLSYRLTPRWSLGLGLTYTFQHTDILSVDGESVRSTVQRLHYVGVPLSVRYAMWRSSRLEVYASAGVMAEKMVSGSADTQASEGRQPMGTTSEKVKMKALQWSFGASAGVDYEVARGLSVYAEPGLDYHIDNGSSVPSYYSDKPLSLSLTLGLRLRVK